MRLLLLVLSLLAVTAVCAGDTLRYRFALDSERGSLTGIMVIADGGDTVSGPRQVTGTVINEFGFSAMSFTYDTRRRRVSLHDVTPFLDSRPVRYALRRDLAAMMRALDGDTTLDARRYTVTRSADTVTIDSRRYRLLYTVSPLSPR